MRPKFILLALLVVFPSIIMAQNEHKIGLMTYGGLPEGKEVQVLYNQAFIVGYSNEMRNPMWVCYRLGNLKQGRNDTGTKPVKWERPFGFDVDFRTSAQVKTDDYIRTGFQRGHMAPNAVILEQFGAMAQLETFLMSNVVPQKEELNENIWLELEDKIRKEITQEDTKNKEVKSVYVITGPIFGDNPKTIGPRGRKIPVPEACFKIIAFGRGFGDTIKAVSFVFPQRPDPNKELIHFVRSVDEIEEMTGLNFFPQLTERKQKNLESVKRNFDFEKIN